MNQEKNVVNHNLKIESREKIEVNGAKQVLSSTEKELVASLDGSFLHIFGSGLKIIKLSPETEYLEVSGRVDMIKYENKNSKRGFLKKVFR